MEVVNKKLVIEKVLEWFVEYNGGAFDTSAQLRLKKLIEDLPNDDVISREDATAEFIKWQTEVAYAFGQDYLGVRIIQSAIDTIREFPSVTPSVTITQ